METTKTEQSGTSPEFFEKYRASKLTVAEMFKMQQELQAEMLDKGTPKDSVEDFKYSVLALISELGEVLDADRRWKNIRGKAVSFEEKKEELCDCMAFMINMILYSGISAELFCDEFIKKNKKNFERIRTQQE